MILTANRESRIESARDNQDTQRRTDKRIRETSTRGREKEKDRDRVREREVTFIDCRRGTRYGRRSAGFGSARSCVTIESICAVHAYCPSTDVAFFIEISRDDSRVGYRRSSQSQLIAFSVSVCREVVSERATKRKGWFVVGVTDARGRRGENM